MAAGESSREMSQVDEDCPDSGRLGPAGAHIEGYYPPPYTPSLPPYTPKCSLQYDA